jgi:xanthine dehydrogenase YagR molybdenum-binding subunit
MPKDISRRSVVQGAAALGTLGLSGQASAQEVMKVQMQTATKTATPYIGAATSRVDGRAKVTGAAQYAAEFSPPGMVYAWVVESTIAKGRIKQIDTQEAMKVAGVLSVLTHQNRPPLPDNDKAYHDDVAPDVGSPFRPLYDGNVKFNGQPIALVLAETSEAANFAASLVKVTYDQEAHVTDIEKARDKAVKIDRPQKPRGDAAAAFAKAAVRHEAEYFIPIEHHNPMELYATTVEWNGNGKITVYDKTQGVQNVQRYVCGVFGLKSDDVRVVSHYMGGGFGSGLRPQYQVVLAVLGAQALKRSVRLVLTRAQLYGLSYRPATIEKLSLGAKADGSLDSLQHEAIAVTSRYEEFLRNDIGWGDVLYKCPNADHAHYLAKLDLATPGDMRAPGAATGVFALESAMDEMAAKLKMDPVEFRLRNYSDVDQTENLPYTSKQLRECYRQAADAFGWSKRNPEPRSMRDGKELVGYGMATGVWEALQMPLAVRIVLTANGHAEISSATSDIGTGTYTIMAQVAADMLGLPIDNITIKLGDSTLPSSPVEGGSWIAASVCNAIVTTADLVREELLRVAGPAFAKATVKDVSLSDGMLVSKKDRSLAVPIAEIMQRAKIQRIEKEQLNEFAKNEKHASNTHSAVFAEVHVDEELGVVRVMRLTAAVAAGRIMNRKTAGSQIMGSLIWGIGMALHEETTIDHRFGRITNANIAEYHVPVNADVQDIQVIFVEEKDDLVNPLGIKGVGEIGIVGVPAAIANAVYHATGKRIRDLPITIDKLMFRAA